jgi:glycosyltransferase involved in cell wall biosynthesis
MTPPRVLHVVGVMNRAGVETWLMHVFRLMDRTALQFDFVVHTDQPGDYDDEIRALGGRILPCPHPRRPWSYARRFRAILRNNGPYRVVHSHVYHYCGFTLKLAAAEGVGVRIAHSHVDVLPQDAAATLLRRLYMRLMSQWIGRYATVGLAASRSAREALFGTLPRDGRWRVHPCSIDLSPFRPPADRTRVRASLGIPPDAFVVGHVGRFHAQKNHDFIVSIASALMRREPGLRLLLVGVGPNQARIRGLLAERGLAEKTVMAGARADVPRLLAAMDCFLFPSRYEGLGLAVVEAQAAGLPCVVSDRVPDEATVMPALVQRLPLTTSEDLWADAVVRARRLGAGVTAGSGLASVERSSFNVRRSLPSLLDLYEQRSQST